MALDPAGNDTIEPGQPRLEATTTPGGHVAKRALMVGATAFIAINLWTGAPLLALWIGSQVVGEQVLSMKAVFVVMIVLAALLYAMTMALAWLNSTYDGLTGRRRTPARSAWLRSMNVETEETLEAQVAFSALERIVMASVYVAVITFLAWFFFLAGSPLPG